MSNADVIRGVYAAFQKGDIPSVLGTMAPDIDDLLARDRARGSRRQAPSAN